MPEDMLLTLQSRFRAQEAWHPDIAWEEVEARLRGNAQHFRALEAMEASGGEPCVLGTEAGRIPLGTDPPKARLAAGAFALTTPRGKPARPIARLETRSAWPKTWACG